MVKYPINNLRFKDLLIFLDDAWMKMKILDT